MVKQTSLIWIQQVSSTLNTTMGCDKGAGGADSTQGDGYKGYQVSETQIEAFNGCVRLEDKGQRLFVVGFNAISGNLFPHGDITRTLPD